MALDKAGWEGGTGAHSQTDGASGDEDQFVLARDLLASVQGSTTVSSGDGMTNIYSAGDQVGGAVDMSASLTGPMVIQADRVSWFDPETVLDPDQTEIWLILGGAGDPVLPGDHSTMVSDASWVIPALVVIPAGGYDSVDVAGGHLHSKAFPHVMALFPPPGPPAVEMAFVTKAITTAGYTTTTGPLLILAGKQGVFPT